MPGPASFQVIDQMRFILTRPQGDSEQLARHLIAMDHSVLIEPMLTIHPCPDAKLKLDHVAAILLTSANGARALADHTKVRDLPVFCVGDATAHVAKTSGFKCVSSANGDSRDLMNLVQLQLNPEDGALVHVAGSSVAGNLKEDLTTHGYKVQRAILYRAENTRRLSKTCISLIRRGDVDGVLFFSPRSASNFVKLLRQDKLAELCRKIMVYGLSKAVAEAAAGVPWKGQNIAALPRQDELLALLKFGEN